MPKLLVAGLLLFPSAIALAGKPAEQTATPTRITSLLACRDIPDSVARLACFDREAAATGAALTRKDLAIIDRDSVRKTRRTLFGLTIPDLGLFGDDNVDAVKQIEGTIADVAMNGDGGYVFTMAEGSRWTQVDDRPFALPPRSGDKVVVKRAALGSYMLSVDRQPGARVRRIN